jgi:hypothetical protein
MDTAPDPTARLPLTVSFPATLAVAANGVHVGNDDGRSVSRLDWAVVLTAATGVSFALLNDVYNHFYSAFGISPVDVGIDQVAILSRTAGLLVFGALLIVMLHVLVLTAFQRWLDSPRRRRLLLVGLTCAVVIAG